MTLSKNNKHWHRYIWCQTSWNFTATTESAHIRICCVWGNTSLLSLLPAWGDCYLDKIPFKHPAFCLHPANRTNQFLAEEEYLQQFSAVWLHSSQLSALTLSHIDYWLQEIGQIPHSSPAACQCLTTQVGKAEYQKCFLALRQALYLSATKCSARFWVNWVVLQILNVFFKQNSKKDK